MNVRSVLSVSVTSMNTAYINLHVYAMFIGQCHIDESTRKGILIRVL